MRVIRVLFLAALMVFCLACVAPGAVRPKRSATRDTQERAAAARAAEEKLTGDVGRGSDLAAISTPKKTATTFTGFPAGTLPGNGGRSAEVAGTTENDAAPSRVALVGAPLIAPISDVNMGDKLDKIAMIADHVGYTLVMRPRYRPRSLLEPAYSYYLMQGRRRLKTLFFDRQLKLVLMN